MKDLIRIQEKDGNNVVSARELHTFLESRQRFTDWIKARIDKYGFIENIDFTLHKIMIGKNWTHEYALTIDTAKEIAMVEGNEKGKQARRYFIECEKKLNKPMSTLDLMAHSVKLLQEQERKNKEFDNRILNLEAKTTTRPSNFTIAGYATLNKIQMPLKLASSLGRKASSICKKLNIVPDEIPDPRFGIVKSYPLNILEEVFCNSAIN